MEAFFFALVFVMFGVFVLIALQAAKRQRQAWSAFAAAHDLEFSGAGLFDKPLITGAYEGVQVEITTIRRGSGKSSKTFTVFRAHVPGGLPAGLHLSREGLGSKVAKLVGSQDIQVGDPALDDAFMIKGEDPERVAALLRQERVRNTLLTFIRTNPGGAIGGGRVMVERRGMATRDLARELDSVASVAGSLGLVSLPGPERRSETASVIEPWSGEAYNSEPAEPWFDEPAEVGAAEGPSIDALLEPEEWAEPPQALPVEAPAPPPHFAEPEPKEVTLDDLEMPPPLGVTPAPPSPEPVPVVDAVAAPAAPAAVLEQVRRLAEERLGTTELQEILASLGGRSWTWSQEVDEVRWTSGLFLAGDLRGGRTTTGKLAGTDVVVSIRHAQARNAELDALSPGATVRAAGRVTDWDDLYRRALIDAEGIGT